MRSLSAYGTISTVQGVLFDQSIQSILRVQLSLEHSNCILLPHSAVLTIRVSETHVPLKCH